MQPQCIGLACAQLQGPQRMLAALLFGTWQQACTVPVCTMPVCTLTKPYQKSVFKQPCYFTNSRALPGGSNLDSTCWHGDFVILCLPHSCDTSPNNDVTLLSGAGEGWLCGCFLAVLQRGGHSAGVACSLRQCRCIQPCSGVGLPLLLCRLVNFRSASAKLCHWQAHRCIFVCELLSVFC